MSMWTALVIIVAVIALSQVMREKHRAGHGTSSNRHQDSTSAPQSDLTMQKELEDLRERIRVLERIATEGHSLEASETRRISEEIEALRKRQDN